MVSRLFFILFFVLMFPSISFAGNRVLVFGDSLTPFIGQSIRETIPDTSIVYRISSGLVNKKFYNWKKKLSTLNLESFDSIVVILGTNDAGYFDYKNVVDDFIQFLKSNTSAKIYWVSIPYMRNPGLNKRAERTNFDIEWVSLKEKISFVDVMKVTKTTQWDLKTRTSDGVHLTSLGGKQIAREILHEIEKE